MCNGGKIFDISFLFLEEWSKKCFVLEIFKESLLPLNQVATFPSFSLIVSKIFSILESEINKLVSPANIIGVSLLELLKRTLWGTKVVHKWKPCATPQVSYGISYFHFYRMIQTVVNIFLITFKLAEIFTFGSIDL